VTDLAADAVSCNRAPSLRRRDVAAIQVRHPAFFLANGVIFLVQLPRLSPG